MEYLSVGEIAKKWNLSERTVRNYCAHGQIPGAFLKGKTWLIPAFATRPSRRQNKKFSDNPLLNVLKEQKDMKLKGGIYYKTQIEFTYNSNHIEGSELSEEQTRFIFETNTIGETNNPINVDDIIETSNHFRCIDFIIENAKKELSEPMIKKLHFILKMGSSDSQKSWFKVGEYKQLPNEIGGEETCPPNEVAKRMKRLLENYNSKQTKALENIVEFHYNFEKIHPFQDGNGRIGRLIMFKECLANNIVPFIIDNDKKFFYYRGLKEWKTEPGFLLGTCLSAQDKYKSFLNYFEIAY